ncbi:glycosyl transferase family 2 [Geodermatophilus tzadiensis]|uniref:Glycosyl transferase family 2 n=1 Tax=Geodermatophilus tzadiensis TaxID=1137988 RepID=A0A2T0TY93_9ACTN|nr:glycosyltransferase [Geodermatophilus tzadiensis]PRY50508.1 glycosyl transferase family 2 [Geodermatophilus tzadiensis]
MSGPVVRVLSGLAVAGAAHAAVNARLLRRAPADPPEVARPVTVVVPVRDEEATIGGCLAAVLASAGVPDLRVVVVDDGSTDGTAAVVRGVGDRRVRLLSAPPPPDGWLGKPHACWVGAQTADDGVLVFVDADVRLAPRALAAAAWLLDAHGLDLVSPWPRPVAVSAAERLVQPLSPWLWLTTLPLRAAERSPRPSLTAANGQFLALTRRGYLRARGHAAVRDQVVEDVALARAVKRAGGRAVPAAGADLATCRMYDGWAAMREGYGKSLWSSVGGSPAAGLAAAAVLTAVGVVPALAALGGSRAGLAGYLAGVAGRVVAAAATGSRVWPDALAHPVSLLALDVLLAGSVRGHRRGTLTWRGRAVG